MLLHAYTRNLLFHYTSRERAVENIFRNMTIRMGPLLGTNDPRETAPWGFSMTLENEGIGPSGERFLEINREIDRNLKNSCRIVCFSEDSPDLNPGLGHPDHYVRDDLGPQGYAHDRMWAQYAGNHTGVCIFFDRARLTQRMEEHFKNRGRLLHGAVSYDSGRMPRDNPFELSYDEIHWSCPVSVALPSFV